MGRGLLETTPDDAPCLRTCGAGDEILGPPRALLIPVLNSALSVSAPIGLVGAYTGTDTAVHGAPQTCGVHGQHTINY